MKKWTKKEEDFLKENASQTNAEIGQALQRSEDSVQKKRRRLGLIQPFVFTPQAIVEQSIKKQSDKDLRKQVEVLTKELILTQKEKDALLKVGNLVTYKIKKEHSDGVLSEATTISQFSDLHGEEGVKRSQVNGLNEYNPEIAQKRTETFYKVVAKMIKVSQKEYVVKNHILHLGGDFISGSIHADLMEGNNIQPTEAIWMVGNWIASGIQHLLEECPDVRFIVPCSLGNHSRITEKPRTQTAYGNSLELLLYNRLKEKFEGNKNIEFLIDDSYFIYVDVYGFKCSFSHGDWIRYSGGIGGPTIPINKAIAQWNKTKHCDYYFFGHFHELFIGSNFIVNGSVIGYNKFAQKIKASFQRPMQAFSLINHDRELEVVKKIILQ